MVQPPNILLERDRTNDHVVRGCSYGALNFKPENSLTKVLDYIYKSFLGYSCNVSVECWRANAIEAAKPDHNLFRGCDLIGTLHVHCWPINFLDTGGGKFSEFASTIGDHFLALV